MRDRNASCTVDDFASTSYFKGDVVHGLFIRLSVEHGCLFSPPYRVKMTNKDDEYDFLFKGLLACV